MDIQEVVNSALYSAYVYNRQQFPDRPYKEWSRALGVDVEEFETLYRLEEGSKHDNQNKTL